MFSSGDYNSLVRMTRIPKLYKLIKISRLVRMLKVVKDRNKLVKQLSEMLKIGVGVERLFFYFLIFFILCHCGACFWILSAKFNNLDPDTWIIKNEFENLSDFDLYISAFYFTVTTIITVGYGDILAFTTIEKSLCIIFMIIGVISFSFLVGSLSSILSNLDSSSAGLKERIATLNEINREYKLDPNLFLELRKAIKYDHSK